MGFCFKRKESVAKAVRRVGRKRIEHALECLKNCRHAEAIHCARKEIKKTRAVLRLTRKGIRKGDYCRVIKLLREAANHLSPVHDTYVRIMALKDLTGHFKGQLAPRAFRHTRGALQKDLREEQRRFTQRKTTSAVDRLLRRIAKDFAQLTVSRKGWQAVCPGVKLAYSKGQKAHGTVLKQSSPENFHEWRKRVKDLWYHVRLLRRVWPEQMDAVANELEALGEHLGQDHDLFVLQKTVQKQCAQDGNMAEFETLRGLIDQRQRELRQAALKLGARFYAEKPSTFSNRLGRYWRLWRRERGDVRAQSPLSRAA